MRRAFTIIELTVTLCILSILSAITIPWAGRVLDRVKVRSAAVEIESLFSAARHIAIARAALATVEIDPVAESITVSVGSDTLRQRRIGVAHGVLISASRARMSYSATGMGYGAANLSVVVRRNASVDTVFVSRLGRVRH
ncbi:MAG TPA: type II secretion system protein [Gemmatimonadaceae bacterium]|nr:type II secretion system protein [Gemmatimonadaceae bacterium]